jgi:hypothetical protein
MNFISPPFSRQWRGMVLCLLMALVVQSITAQIHQYPDDKQLYPRQKNNKATVPISGTFEQNSGYNAVLLKVYRNGKLASQRTALLMYRSGKASFSFKEDIKAELADYRFELYGVKGLSQTLIRSADQVVAGDAYIIQGQSNAVANLRGNPTAENDANSSANAPYRNFVRVYGSGIPSYGFTKAWFIADGNTWFENDGNSGQWGLRMASNLAGSQKIPIAIFNGADPGQPLQFFQRNDGNPTDLGTNYGRLLSRIKEAGFEKNISAILWFQGESDALGALSNTQLTTEQYKQGFMALYSDWKKDYPGIQQVYIFQIRHGCGIASVDGSLQIQEAQRQLALEQKDISVMSTSASTQLFDGGTINYCHYNFPDGYKSFGDWITELVKRDIYKVKNLPNSINPPTPQKAAFTSVADNGLASQVRLTLEDPKGKFTALGNLASEFRLEGGNFPITNVSINGNNVDIDFIRTAGTNGNPTGLSFVGHDNQSAPMLVNERGIGLLYFYNLPIAVPPRKPEGPCNDPYERLSLLGTEIKMNSTIKALISSVLDTDRFYFDANKNNKGIRIELTDLPADYDIYLYNSLGKQVGVSKKPGKADEVIKIDEITKKERFTILVVGKNGAHDHKKCYTLKLYRQNVGDNNVGDDAVLGSAVQNSAMEAVAKVQPGEFSVFPNPVQDRVTISWPATKAGTAEIRLVDLNGRQVKAERLAVQNGANLLYMQVGGLPPGVYLLQITQDNQTITRKLTITR